MVLGEDDIPEMPSKGLKKSSGGTNDLINEQIGRRQPIGFSDARKSFMKRHPAISTVSALIMVGASYLTAGAVIPKSYKNFGARLDPAEIVSRAGPALVRKEITPKENYFIAGISNLPEGEFDVPAEELTQSHQNNYVAQIKDLLEGEFDVPASADSKEFSAYDSTLVVGGEEVIAGTGDSVLVSLGGADCVQPRREDATYQQTRTIMPSVTKPAGLKRILFADADAGRIQEEDLTAGAESSRGYTPKTSDAESGGYIETIGADSVALTTTTLDAIGCLDGTLEQREVLYGGNNFLGKIPDRRFFGGKKTRATWNKFADTLGSSEKVFVYAETDKTYGTLVEAIVSTNPFLYSGSDKEGCLEIRAVSEGQCLSPSVLNGVKSVSSDDDSYTLTTMPVNDATGYIGGVLIKHREDLNITKVLDMNAVYITPVPLRKYPAKTEGYSGYSDLGGSTGGKGHGSGGSTGGGGHGSGGGDGAGGAR